MGDVKNMQAKRHDQDVKNKWQPTTEREWHQPLRYVYHWTKHIDVIVLQCRIYEGGGVDGSPCGWSSLKHIMFHLAQHLLPFNIIILSCTSNNDATSPSTAANALLGCLTDISSTYINGMVRPSIFTRLFLGGVILNYFKMPRLSYSSSLFGRLSNQ